MAGTVVAAAVPAFLIKTAHGRSSVPAQELTCYEAGFLAAGAKRVVDVAIAELLGSGLMRINSTWGTLIPVSSSRHHPDDLLSGQVHGQRPAGNPAPVLRDTVRPPVATGLAATGVAQAIVAARSQDARLTVPEWERYGRCPGISQVARRVRASGLLISRRRTIIVQCLAAGLPAVLLLAGVLRLIEGASNSRPIADLVAWMVIVFLSLPLISLWAFVSAAGTRTQAGVQLLQQLQSDPAWAKADMAAGPGSGSAAGTGQIWARKVAVSGFAGIPDSDVRRAVLLTSSKNSSSSSSRSLSDSPLVGCSSCSGGCGSGCGG